MRKETHSYRDFSIEREGDSEKFVFKMPEEKVEKLIKWSQERIGSFEYRKFVEYEFAKKDYNDFCKIDSVWECPSAEGFSLPENASSVEIIKTIINKKDILLFSKSSSRWRVLIGNLSELMIYSISTDAYGPYNPRIRDRIDNLFDSYQRDRNLKKEKEITEKAINIRRDIASRIEEILR